MTKHLTDYERETILNTTDADDYLTIWTAQKPVLRALRNKAKQNQNITETKSGSYGSSPWAEFRIPVTDVSWSGLVKRGGELPTETLIHPENSGATVVSGRGSYVPANERETKAMTSDFANTLVIETYQRKVITALRNKAKASDKITEVASRYEGTTEWAMFEIDGEDASWSGFIKRKGSPRRTSFSSAENAGATAASEQERDAA
ncbi:hypothetical protein [Nocardioides sp.]|uniref:hypothetical protein n=1 Tax=Nocardioides sp. TaxID=35761 RepID=UPI002CF054AB|nr:hypothetical protein [Nocardioides sp.]HSX68451.1 hypothetical protein [Nocardioides sp.]